MEAVGSKEQMLLQWWGPQEPHVWESGPEFKLKGISALPREGRSIGVS